MDQAEFVKHTLDVLQQLNLKYAIVGSFASIAFGEPRYTHDIDILLDLPAERVLELCQSFPSPDWYVSASAAAEAIQQRSQFNVIHTTSGNKIDFILAKNDDWGRLQFERRQRVGIVGEVAGFAAHPEDVILGKLLYYQEGGSDKHLRDIAGILAISRHLIDPQRLGEWAKKLGVADIWQAVVSQQPASLDLGPPPSTE